MKKQYLYNQYFEEANRLEKKYREELESRIQTEFPGYTIRVELRGGCSITLTHGDRTVRFNQTLSGYGVSKSPLRVAPGFRQKQISLRGQLGWVPDPSRFTDKEVEAITERLVRHLLVKPRKRK